MVVVRGVVKGVFMICNCTLPYYNPDACKVCHNYVEYGYSFPFCGYSSNDFIVIKTKKVTERYDKNGNLIEKITEEGTR